MHCEDGSIRNAAHNACFKKEGNNIFARPCIDGMDRHTGDMHADYKFRIGRQFNFNDVGGSRPITQETTQLIHEGSG